MSAPITPGDTTVKVMVVRDDPCVSAVTLTPPTTATPKSLGAAMAGCRLLSREIIVQLTTSLIRTTRLACDNEPTQFKVDCADGLPTEQCKHQTKHGELRTEFNN